MKHSIDVVLYKRYKLSQEATSNPFPPKGKCRGNEMPEIRRLGRPILVQEERRAIANRKTQQVSARGLVSSLASLLERDEPLEDDVVAVLADMRYLDCIPFEALLLIDRLLQKYPPKRPPSRI